MWHRLFRCTWGIVFVLMSGCSQLEGLALQRRPRVRAVRPRISGIDFKAISLAFDVDVENPYSFPLHTPRFRYGIDIEDAEFIKSEDDVEVDLPAQKTGTVTLPVRLDYGQLWRTYQRLSGAKEVSYLLHGTFLVSAGEQSFELPVKHSGTFPVLRVPAIAPGEVETDDVSLSNAKVRVHADIKNPNIFALGLDDIGYELQLGEVRVGRINASTNSSVAPGESGRLTLTGEISGLAALRQLLAGKSLGRARISASGTVQTPYGAVKMPD